MKRSLCGLLFTVCGLGYANELDRIPEQNEVKITPVVEQQALETEQVPKAELAGTEKQGVIVVKYTGRELIEKPQILEDLLIKALLSANTPLLKGYISLYKLVPTADHSLIEWAEAIITRESDLNGAVRKYRALITQFPDNTFIRFQLADTLFHNQEFEAAKAQFEKLRSVHENEKDIALFNQYIEAIQQKSDWNFAFGASFLNDKNLNNSAKVGTSAMLPNGATVTYSTPRESGQGISAWFGTDKQWNLQSGKYLKLTSSLAQKYYWNNKGYNDLNASIGFGLGYADARFNLELIPNLQKRWYAGGASGSSSLKRYIDTYGGTFSTSYWLTPKFRFALEYEYGYEKYRNPLFQRQYNGATHSLSNSLTYLPSAQRYIALSFDLSQKKAKDLINAYKRAGMRVTVGSELPLGFSTAVTVGIAKRHYKEASFFGVKQKNKEYSASVTLWHKKVHYAGFTPKVTYSYTKTGSNIPIYTYDKHQVFFNVSKTF